MSSFSETALRKFWDPDEHHTSLRMCSRANRDMHNIQTSHLQQSFCASIFTDNRPYCEQPYLWFIHPNFAKIAQFHVSFLHRWNYKALGLCIWCALSLLWLKDCCCHQASVSVCSWQVERVWDETITQWFMMMCFIDVSFFYCTSCDCGVVCCAGQDSLDSESSGLELVLAQSD